MSYNKDKTIKARQVNLVDYCEYKDYELIPDGCEGNYRVKGYSGLIIEGNHFKWFGNNKDGNAVDFCVDVLGMKFKDAVEDLLSFQNKKKERQKDLPYAKSSVGAGLEKKRSAFVLPEKYSDNKRVYAYLTITRGLPGELINELIDNGLLYQEPSHNNCVFPCYDESGQPRGAISRGTLTDRFFKGWASGSNTKFGWLLIPEKEARDVVVTEAPIDALSIIAYYPSSTIRSKYILVLGGLFIESLKRFLDSHLQVNRIILGVDNDNPASKFVQEVKDKLGDKYKIIEFRPKNKKDWNEELLAKQQ